MPQSETTAPETPVNQLASEEEAAKFRLDPYLVSLMLHEPFFSHVLRGFDKISSDAVPTAGIGVKDQNVFLVWNPRFLASLEPIRVRGLLKHECYHWIFKHCTARKQEPHKLWNWATDLAINSLILETELPEGGLIPGQSLDLSQLEDPTQKEKWQKVSDLIESFPKDKASEWYFAELSKDPDVKEAIEGDGGDGVAFMDDHGEWGDLTEEERQIVEGKIKKTLSDAVKKCDSSGQWGSIGSDVREKIRSMVSNEVPWETLLRSFCGMTQRANKRRTMKRINRKYPYIHPGVRANHTAALAVYMDQSASVSTADIALLFGELNNLGKKIDFHLFPFDTTVDVENAIKWRKGQKPPAVRSRSGGTSFHAAQEHFHNNLDRFDGMIILTDGECSDPGPSRKRRAWVIVPGRRLYFDPHANDTLIQMKGRSDS
jgi:predicted metal-dependent peptidase|tara:strand:+ start:2144 stop:3433 length:1290 start_codon:yes stop_codon:yes gene_type:complete